MLMYALETVPGNQKAANLSGSISIACWVFLLLPQLLEQWRLKSADGIAIGFIISWMVGDVANLLGSVIGHLRPSVILLALWFCFSDSLLVLSYVYYKRQVHLKSLLAETQPSQSTPLLDAGAQPTPAPPHSAKPLPWWVSTGIPLVCVFAVAWFSYSLSAHSPDNQPDVKQPLLAELLGYFSAIMYLCGRIPQIIQNHQRRSVEGLSVGFFTLSMLGNFTYAGPILLYRRDSEWIKAYMPWLLGSLGTIVEDSIIFAQFFIYKST